MSRRTLTLTASTTDGHATYYDTSWPTCLTGPATGAGGAADVDALIGMDFVTPNYTHRQYLLEFDTGALPRDADIESVTLAMSLNRADSWTATEFLYEVRAYDWGGGTINTDDYVASADQGALTLLATLESSLATTQYQRLNFTSTPMFAAAVSGGGMIRLGIFSKNHRLELAPTNAQYQWWATADNATPAYRPTLTIVYRTQPGNLLRCYTAGAVLDRIVRADVEVSDTYAELPTLTASIPRTLLDGEGVEGDQVAGMNTIRTVEYDGTRYRVSGLTDDFEAPVTLEAEHLLVELGDVRATWGVLPYDMIGTPQDVVDPLLTNLRRIQVPGGRFSEVVPGSEQAVGWMLIRGHGTTATWDTGSADAVVGWRWFADSPARGRCLKALAGIATPPSLCSEDIPVVAGSRYSLALTYRALVTPITGTLTCYVQAVAPDGSLVGPWVSYEMVASATTSWSERFLDITALTSRFRVWITPLNISQAVAIDDVYLKQAGPTMPSAWTFVSEKETRATGEDDIEVDGAELAYDATVWTQAGNHLSCTTTREPVTFYVTGTEFTVYYGPNQTGRVATFINGVEVGSAPTVTGPTSQTFSTLGLVTPSHRVQTYQEGAGTIELGRAADGVAVTLGSSRIVHLSSTGTVLEALAQLQTLTGGGYEVDTATRTLTLKAVGRDLRAENVLELRAPQLVSFERIVDTTLIENSLMLRGGDDLSTLLSYHATPEGVASEAEHEERWGKYDNSSITDLSSLIAAGKAYQRVASQATVTYAAEVEEATGALIEPGDMLRVYYEDIDVTVRVLAKGESSEGNPVVLTLGTRQTEALDELRRAL